MFNCWKNIPDYFEFIKNQWQSLSIVGRATYVAKEKLKLIKQRLKVWIKDHKEGYEQQLKEAKEELNSWDLKGENAAL